MEFFGYRKLIAYTKACEIRRNVYRLIKGFPKEEQFALNSQLRRSAISITSNIAEGMSRYSNKDKVHFLEMAFGSLMEVMSQLEIAVEENYISDTEFHNMETLVNSTCNIRLAKDFSFTKRQNHNRIITTHKLS